MPVAQAAAPVVTQVTVNTNSAAITFDQDVVGDSSSGSAANLSNYLLQSPTGTNYPLSQQYFDHWMNYDNASKTARIYGLGLTQNATWRMAVNNIVNGSAEAMASTYYSSGADTVAASTDPRIDNITPIYAKAGDTITVSGANFGNPRGTGEADVDNEVASSYASWTATSLSFAVPAGTTGEKRIKLKNSSNIYSNFRNLYRYDISKGVLTGTIKDTDAANVDNVVVQAYKDTEPWNRYQGKSQKDGKFAVLVPAGTFNLEFITPGAGSLGAAPVKATGKVVALDAVTNIGDVTFQTKAIYGTVKASDGTTPLYNASIRVHDQSWTVEQNAVTGRDGGYKIYVAPSTTPYVIEVSPSQYDATVNGYLSTTATQSVTSASPSNNLKNITLPSMNVNGIVMTPTGSASDSNPFPNAAVPRARVHIFKSDWTFDRWADADSNGAFQFGGVPDGTYVLEIEPTFCGDNDPNVAKFCGYTKTRFENVAIAGASNDLGIKRYASPNFYGYVYADANSNNTYNFTDTNANSTCDTNIAGETGANTEGKANAWININKDGFWTNAQTDACGKFAVSLPNTGSYHIDVQGVTGFASYNADISVPALPISSPQYIKLSAPNFSGYVYGPSGSTGQQNAWINLCPASGPGNCYGSGSDMAGQFNANVPDGTWSLQVNPNWSSVYTAPGPKTVVAAGGVVTSVDSDTNDADEPLLANGTVVIRLVDPANDPLGFSGTVKGPVGSPDENTGQANVGIGFRQATGTVSSCQGDGMSRWSQTNAQGAFAFSGVADGLYEIEAMPWGGGAYSRARVCHLVGSGTRTKTINLTLPNITGTIATPTSAEVSDVNSNPTPDIAVGNTWVSMFVEGPMGPGGGWYGGNADNNGVFSLGGVPAGTYTLEVSAPWGSVYSSKRYQGIVLADSNSDGIADTTNLNTTLGTVSAGFPAKALRLGTPNIKGRIMSPGADGDPATAGDNLPVANTWVMVHNSNWTQNAGGNTDTDGYFRIGGLNDGTGYGIEINMPWGTAQALTAPSALTVDVASGVGVIKETGTPLANNTITLTVPQKTISGVVYKDANSNNVYDSGTDTVVANANVEAHRDMGGGFFNTRTASNGTYTLKVSGGSWWTETRPSWEGTQPDWVYTEPPSRVTFAEDSSTQSQTVNFKVTSADATITGTVKNPQNSAVQNAWVDARGGRGMGNGSQTDVNGQFSIRVPAGTYNINVFSSLADYGSPASQSVTVASGEAADAGTLYLVAKNSTITGFVQDDSGNPVSNVAVNAWLFDGAGWGMAFTDQTGAYSLSVSAGTWGLMVAPMSQSYVYVGTPKKIAIVANETSSGNNFVLKTANKTLKVTVKKSDNTVVSDIWGGVWVRDTNASGGGMMDFGGPKEDMMAKGDPGMTSGGPGMDQGGFAGGGLNNGYTEIKVPAGTYEVGLGMPPGSNYTLNGTTQVTVGASDTSASVDLIVVENDAIVSGHFYVDTNSDGGYDAGEEVGVRAFVNADRDGGGWQFTESNSTDGSYTLNVAAGNWYVDGFIDPYMSFGSVQYMVINEDILNTVSNSTPTIVNFKLKKLDGTIEGTVKNPDGSAMTDGLVWIFVDFGTKEMVDEFKGPGGPGLGTFTEANGTYSLKVPAGTYKIGAGIPPWDARSLLNPDPLTVTVGADGTVTGKDLQFEASDAIISGNITFGGDNKAGFVRAWSDGGRGAGAESIDGSYTLNVTLNDTWHVVAAANISGNYYESAEATVNTSSGSSPFDQDLVLVSKGIAVSSGVSASFDATESKTLKLTKSDGTDEVVLDIPAASIATSGTITVSITPTVNVKPDSKDKPVGFSYEFEARDANGTKIESFVQNVTIYMSYDPTLIAAAGYSEDSITPKYYDTTTGSWENYSNVVRDTENNRFIIKSNHFSSGGTVGGNVPSAPSLLNATAASSTSMSLVWSDNSSDETGFKVYRAGVLITTTAANAESYTDSGLTASTSYSYYVKAVNAAGDSAASNTATAITSATQNNTGGGGGGVSVSTPPTNTSIVIAGGAANTLVREVTLTLAATGATQMAISNTADFAGVSWETYAASKSWTLTAGDGTKTVYAKFRDAGGDVSTAVSDTIILGTSTGTETPSASTSIYPDGTLIKSDSAPEIYVIKDGKRVWIPNAEAFISGGYKWENVKVVSGEVIKQVGSATLIRVAGDPRVYVVVNNARRHIKTAEEFNSQGYKWADIVTVSAAELEAYPESGAVAVGGKTIVVTAASLRIRSTNSTGGKALGWVKKDDNYSVLDENNGWYKITSKTGITGWVSGQYATAASAAAGETPSSMASGNIVINNKWLRVRSISSTKGTILGYVNQGEIYALLGEENGWYKIKTKKGKEGWVSGEYAAKQ
ncbi:MAG: SH3 domain-containing protein [Candidatus Omnitrophica bacterium]|nr:SH3 domain-containing protein [Candidatus Omnitrophota bacterium]